MKKSYDFSLVIVLMAILFLGVLTPRTTEAATYKGTIKKIEKAFKVGKKTYHEGYYYYPNKRKRAKKAGVVYISEKTVIKGRTFQGYYYYDKTGAITVKEWGLIKLDRVKSSNGKTFNGYYYRDKGGKILRRKAIRKIKGKNASNPQYPGYHYFDKTGKMVTTKQIHYLNLTYKGHRYKGYYCFGGDQGKMVRKSALVQIGERHYFVQDKYGKCLTSGRKTIDGLQYTFNKKGVGTRKSKLGNLKKKLTKMTNGYNGTWSVYVKRLDNNDSLVINNKSLYAASIIKPFVMASFYQQVEDGRLKATPSLNSTVSQMITVSDNEAYNRLVRVQGKNNFMTGKNTVNKYLSNYNYKNTAVHHTLHPSSSGFLGDGGRNVTSVQDCGNLLEEIYRGKCVNKSSSKRMLGYLKGQTRRWKIPAGLPAGIKVANKTGETSTADHDIAIVYGKKCTYIICVMSVNSSNSSSRIAGISRVVYNALN